MPAAVGALPNEAPAMLVEIARALAQNDSPDRLTGALRRASPPIVEPLPDGRCRVTFVWLGDAPAVGIYSQLVGWSPGDVRMSRIDGTDVWWRSVIVRDDVSTNYWFWPGDPLVDPPSPASPAADDAAYYAAMIAGVRADPFAVESFPSLLTIYGVDVVESVLRLPRYAASRFEDATPLPRPGRTYDHVVEGTRRIRVYEPAAVAPGSPAPMLLLLDGSAFDQVIDAPGIAERVLGASAPRIVLVDPQTPASRKVELAANAAFVDHLVTVLVPWLRQGYPTPDEPAARWVGGASYGGLTALYAALHHPEVFRGVVSLSGSFWFSATEPMLPLTWVNARSASGLRVAMSAGVLEDRASIAGPSLLASNRRLRDVLARVGASVWFEEFSGGHEARLWRASLARALTSTYPR